MKKYIVVFFLLFTLFILNENVYAKPINFSATPISTKSDPLKDGFFNYNLSGPRILKVSVRLNNSSNKTIKVINQVNDAFNNDGSIIYLDKNVDKKNKVSDMVIGKRKKITFLKPKSKKIVSFKLRTPSKKENYISLGSITSSVKTDVGRVNYNNTILLKQNIENFNINNVKVSNFKVNNKKASFDINNAQDNVLQNSVLKIRLLKNGKVVKKISKYNYSMIPNSKNRIGLYSSKLKNGKYKLSIEVISGNKKNQMMVTNYKELNGLIKIFIILILIFSVFLFLVIFKRRRK